MNKASEISYAVGCYTRILAGDRVAKVVPTFTERNQQPSSQFFPSAVIDIVFHNEFKIVGRSSYCYCYKPSLSANYTPSDSYTYYSLDPIPELFGELKRRVKFRHT